ncbi:MULTISPECIES: fluoride efflux transporter FluC [Thermomonosporaceae]|uniref:fluoride efflux transporter FluC n=1 Tax=Thermomonosporaceae TaxID=2012 RepID=UPI00255ACD40|nr:MULTISPECIES: CrcB family protein [Thermomonosporaceae]MDL4775846.1 CrcB family protein [Actinomadura xylanilytica]
MIPAKELTAIAAVAVGGAAGSLCRYLVSEAVGSEPDHTALLGTFLVNISGCLFIGFLSMSLSELWPSGKYANALLVTGFLGGFTTFSHFMTQVRTMLGDGHWPLGIGYTVLCVLLGWFAVWLGQRAGHAVARGVR